MKVEMVECAGQVLEFVRDDYHEFTELSLLYLGAGDKEVTFQRPGALHIARWMAKLIYMLKIALFETQIKELPPGTITTRQQMPKVRAFATSITMSTAYGGSRATKQSMHHGMTSSCINACFSTR